MVGIIWKKLCGRNICKSERFILKTKTQTLECLHYKLPDRTSGLGQNCPLTDM
jgi:hypothetical protein